MEEGTYNSTHIYKPLIAGVFAGYIATLIDLFYDVIFKEKTNFPFHELVNVSTIIFGIMLLVPLAGCVFALIDKYFKKNTAVIYIILSTIVTVVLCYAVMHTHRSSDPQLNVQFHNLLLGITIITGLFSTFGIPYLVKHSNLYM